MRPRLLLRSSSTGQREGRGGGWSLPEGVVGRGIEENPLRGTSSRYWHRKGLGLGTPVTPHFHEQPRTQPREGFDGEVPGQPEERV